jgi:hypothetical protein
MLDVVKEKKQQRMGHHEQRKRQKSVGKKLGKNYLKL